MATRRAGAELLAQSRPTVHRQQRQSKALLAASQSLSLTQPSSSRTFVTSLPAAAVPVSSAASASSSSSPPAASSSSSSSSRSTISSQSQPEPSLAPLRVIHPPSHLASHFWPPELKQHYLTLQSLFLELSHVPTTVSSEILGRIRYGWWRDAIAAAFRKEGRRFKHPIVVALEEMVWDENVRRRGGLVHDHFEAIVDAWEAALSSSPTAPALADLEASAERIYSRQLYLQLNLLGVDSRPVDEIFSHLGKAYGLVEAIIDTPMRMGVKLQPKSGAQNDEGFGARVPKNRKPPLSETTRGFPLPHEFLAKHGVVQEEVMRMGGRAKGFKDAIFDTATRANDYLITVRKEIREELPGGRVPAVGSKDNLGARPALVGMGTIPHLLARLEKHDFDPFEPAFRIEARGNGWRLPLRMWKMGWTGRI